MRQKFHGSTRVKWAQLQALRKDYETLHMKEGENTSFAKKMKACGEAIQEKLIIEKIL